MEKAKQLILLALFVTFVSSCAKNNDNTGTGPNALPPIFPTLITTNVISITSSSAVAGGTILDSTGYSILSRGICYGISPNPTLANNVVTAKVDSGFTVNLTNLQDTTTYYVCAFATNSSGTGYGNQVTFKTAFAIGQSYQGGIVFYVDVRGIHGKIVASTEISGTYPWGCEGTDITMADSAGIGYGQQNTTAILQNCNAAGIAALVCQNYRGGGYTDWFLPSRNELIEMYLQRRALGSFSNTEYWSSTQRDANNAYYVNFTTGNLTDTLATKGISAGVRPIRAF